MWEARDLGIKCNTHSPVMQHPPPPECNDLRSSTHRVWEASDLGAQDGQGGVAVPPASAVISHQVSTWVAAHPSRYSIQPMHGKPWPGTHKRPIPSGKCTRNWTQCTCLPADAVVGPSSGFSLIMHTLVSRLHKDRNGMQSASEQW